MNLANLKEKNILELKTELIKLYREKFKLLLEKSGGSEFNKSHLLKNLKKNIARTLTLITEKKISKI